MACLGSYLDITISYYLSAFYLGSIIGYYLADSLLLSFIRLLFYSFLLLTIPLLLGSFTYSSGFPQGSTSLFTTYPFSLGLFVSSLPSSPLSRLSLGESLSWDRYYFFLASLGLFMPLVLLYVVPFHLPPASFSIVSVLI